MQHSRSWSARRFVLLLMGFSLCLMGLVHCAAPGVGPGVSFCQTESDCAAGQECSLGTCINTPAFRQDAASVDVGVPERSTEPPADRPAPVDTPVEPTPDADAGNDAPPDVGPDRVRDDAPDAIKDEPPDGSCQSDTDCRQDGEICESGMCVAGCRNRDACSNGQICKENKCADCTDDGECLSGELCLGNRCKKGDCRVTGDCSGGLICKANVCSACTQDTECPSGNLCTNGMCVPGSCRKRSDCPAGLLCDMQQCVGCKTDKECSSNELCLSAACKTAECRTNAECSAEDVCRGNQCESCLDTKECDSGEVCDNGKCKVGNCVDRNQCPNGEICTNNKCTKCQDKSDCDSSEVCDAGLCLKGNCVQNGDCSNGQVCLQRFCVNCTQSTQCGSGYVCLNSKCVVGDCVNDSDCAGGAKCTGNKCVGCARDSDCPAATPKCDNQLCREWNLVQFGTFPKAYRWENRTVPKDCQGYIKPAAGYKAGTLDGLYWIKPTGSRNDFKTYCDMTYQGGGWTMILKVKGDANTFKYTSKYWEDTRSYGTSPNFDNRPAKLESYWRVPMKELLVRFRDPINGTSSSDLRSIVVEYTANSFLDMMKKPGKNHSFTKGVGLSGWRSLMKSPSLQPKCNREGFKLDTDSGDAEKVRLGFVTGDKDDCRSLDSFIGVGCEKCGVFSGNWAKNTSTGDRTVPVFVYLFVRSR